MKLPTYRTKVYLRERLLMYHRDHVNKVNELKLRLKEHTKSRHSFNKPYLNAGAARWEHIRDTLRERIRLNGRQAQRFWSAYAYMDMEGINDE